MSSHHIVREKQEPALVILGMESFTNELLGQLLEWSPTVIVAADIAEQLTSADIKVDIIIGSAGNIATQSDVKSIQSDSSSEVQAALNYLTATHYPAVNIITDDFVLADYLAFADKIGLVIYCGNSKIYPVSSGFSKWKPAGEAVRILNPGDDVSAAGLQKTADENYIMLRDGFFSLQFERRYLFIAEDIL
ncbi:hypothetical protein BEL04_23690 [Mucilaginibacter sp. PPCGB 2223]|uniref:hypothetical protein n=1 Tax=Mucilaginibacter sp. PPCGB 2223 TaxID=1886027 RepID=UPI00082469BC|nr:hypothetical protein [Mucilaginibacter sp. PPCGB 2223]OCX50313.1 hypothetical protein BEL04_23690 [Mucilaginibacter sp. PPCGB 2223]